MGAQAGARVSLPAATSYVLVGALLLVTRLVGLDRGYASDELMTVDNYVSAGVREILFGTYIPNNHVLFSLLAWALWSVVGESAIALRLLSVVPFVLGSFAVTAWLHRRVGALSAVLFLLLATASPLLVDISRQGRGYGLAFLASAVLVVASLEALRTPRPSLVVVACAAGVVGSWTLPHFAVAFVATALWLLADRTLRRPTTIGLVVSLVATAAWYAPHIAQIHESSGQEYAAPIVSTWLLTAPFDHVLTPALGAIDEALIVPGVVSLAVAGALLLTMISSPLLRDRRTAPVLVGGTIATLVVFWITDTNLAPRFASFLLAPLLMVLATGAGALLARRPAGPGRTLRSALAAGTVVTVAALSVDDTWRILRLPREATEDVAAFIRDRSTPTTPIYAYMPYPHDLERYLDREVHLLEGEDDARRACSLRRARILITQPWLLPPLELPCTSDPAARHVRFEQYARGRRMDVWLIPASASP